MSKRTEKALNEKLNVKLPENLSKDNILEQLQNVQQNEKIVEMPRKKTNGRQIAMIAASLAVVFGVLTVFFGAGLSGIKTEENASDKTEVVRYQSYDKIYDKFDDLRKEYKKNNVELFGDIFNIGGYDYSSTNGAVAEDMAGDIVVQDSDDELWGGSVTTETTGGDFASNSITRPSTENRDEAIDEESAEEKNHGTTNTQENGVDEGDIIKTDGNYLYIANGDKKSVSIVDVTGEEMKISAQIKLDAAREAADEIYINGNQLVILGEVSPDNKVIKKNADGTETITIYDYAYAVRNTFVKVYDVTDRTAPKLVTEYSQQGNYDNSRMIGTKLYCVSAYYVDITADDYRDRCIPETEINGVCEKIEAGCISVVEDSNSTTYAIITTLDVASGTEPSCEAILGNCEELYATAQGLFLSETDYYSESYHDYQQTTKIYRFEYTDTGVDYKCMGRVDGYINDQFSMSYDGEYFRIATTVNKTVTYDENGEAVEVQLWDEDGWRNKDLDDVVVENVTMNNLYILNNNMQIVGKVEDLAKGETIKSVRFVGDMAYVVTFRQTDPLFVIDLSDPENPTVKGELKIPGFSEYLHPIADGLLVGVGYDGNEWGTNGDCKVSLFDVTNPYEPVESSVLPVSNGTADCYPSVANNHKLYIKLSANEFAVPFIVHRYVDTGEYYTNKSYICYIRYRLTGNELCEVARYDVAGIDAEIMGATYVGNIFYAVVLEHNFNQDFDTYVVAYDLTTNEEIGRLQTAD